MNEHDPQPEARESAEALRTAYALGELDDAERLEALRQWESDPAAKQEAESLADVARWLKRAVAAVFPPSAEPSTVLAAVEAKLAQQALPVMATVSPAWSRRLQTLRRPRLAVAAAIAAGLALLAVPVSVAIRNGRNDVASQQPADKPSPSDSTREPGVEAPSPQRDPKSPPTVPDSSLAHKTPGAGPTSKPPSGDLGKPIAPSVAQGPGATHPGGAVDGPGAPTDPAMQEWLLSRRLRGEALRSVHASFDRAKPPPSDNKARPVLGNLPPEAPNADRNGPHSKVAARRVVVEFPFAPVRKDESGAFPLRLQGDSYARVKDFLQRGELPPPNDVWPEEFVSYFPYEDPAAQPAPLGVMLESARCPWNAKNLLVRATLRTAGPSSGDPLVSTAPAGVQWFHVTIQFAPETVAKYRLIACAEMPDTGAKTAIAPSRLQGLPPGQTVTALYELTLLDVTTLSDLDDPSTRTKPRRPAEVSNAKRRLFSLDWDCGSSAGTQVHVSYESGKRFDNASTDFRFAATAAAFAMILRNSPHRGEMDLKELAPIVEAALGPDPGGKRAEMLALIRKAQSLKDRQTSSPKAP